MTVQRSWYLVYTKPRQEQLAEENLNRQGYETYLPLVQNTRRRNGRYIKIIESFFPRYLFIHLDCVRDNWAPIRSTLGVSKIVEFGGVPAIVPEQLINGLQQNQDERGLQQINETELKPGDEVVIIDGSFAGNTGIFQQRKGAGRVAVLMDIIGKYTEVTLSEHQLSISGSDTN